MLSMQFLFTCGKGLGQICHDFALACFPAGHNYRFLGRVALYWNLNCDRCVSVRKISEKLLPAGHTAAAIN
jgi:hypothetical protein